MNNNEKIILFPTHKENLKQESMDAIQEKNYEKALSQLNILLTYEDSHDLLIGKLICLIELGQFNEAESLCEDLIARKDEHYFEYIHMYTTLLFQTSQYDELLDRLEQLFDTEQVPMPIYNQLNQLYEVTKKLHENKIEDDLSHFMDQLKVAVRKQNTPLQWRIIEQCKQLDVTPPIAYIKELLIDEEIDPLVKTSILLWLVKKDVNNEVVIQKFDETTVLIPSEYQQIESHPYTKQVTDSLTWIEQENPTLFEMIKKLLYRYVYVRYPMIATDEDLPVVAKALTILAYGYLQLESNIPIDKEHEEKLNFYKNEILACESHFLSIIED